MSVHQLFPATRPVAGLAPILFPIESMGRMKCERATAVALHDSLAHRVPAHLIARQLAWAFRLDARIAREEVARNRYARPDNSPAWILRSKPSPEDLHDMRQPPIPLSLQDLTVVVSAMILAVTACLILGLAVLRADRPAVCRAHDLTGAECAAAVKEGL